MPRRTEKAAGDTGLVLPDSRAVGNALPPALPSGQRGHCSCTAIGSAGPLSPRPPSQVPTGESESKQSCVSSSPGTGGRTAWGRLPVGQSTHFGFPPIKPVIRSTEKAPTWATQGASRGLPQPAGGHASPQNQASARSWACDHQWRGVGSSVIPRVPVDVPLPGGWWFPTAAAPAS